MKKHKRAATILVALVMLFSGLGFSTQVQGEVVTDFDELQAFFTTYSGEGIWEFVDISEFPEDVVPSIFDSFQEAKGLVEHSYLIEPYTNIFYVVTSEFGFSPLSIMIYHRTIGGQVVSPFPRIEIRLNAWITRDNVRFFDISPYTVMAGFAAGNSWTQSSAGSNIATDGRSFNAWASGVWSTYIIINGIGVVYRRPLTFQGWGNF